MKVYIEAGGEFTKKKPEALEIEEFCALNTGGKNSNVLMKIKELIPKVFSNTELITWF